MSSMKFMFAHYEGDDPAGALKAALDSFTVDEPTPAISASGKQDADAWYEWAANNAKSFDSSTIGPKCEHNEYLENRLYSAWQAGMEYGRRAAGGRE